MKDAQILTWSAGSTAERGNSTERSPHMSMTENGSRGSVSPQGTVKKGIAMLLVSSFGILSGKAFELP